MSELSPQAQEIFDAFCREAHPEPHHQREAIAAALRAAVNQVLPESINPVGDEHDAARADQWLRIRLKMLAIAAELQGH